MSASLPLEQFTLPARPHRPGPGRRPDMALLEAAKAACPKITEPARWQENRTYRAGWNLYDAGFYWEAHELWEAVWLACRPNSLEQRFLKMIIQNSNARLKEAMDRDKAAARLRDEVGHLLGEMKGVLGPGTSSYMGVELELFEQEAL